MVPTLAPGDRLLVDRKAFRRRPPAVGELVLLTDPEVPERLLIKRVGTRPPGSPAGGVWVLGDSPAVSRDSRQFGAVAASAIRGRVWYRYLPPERAGPVG